MSLENLAELLKDEIEELLSALDVAVGLVGLVSEPLKKKWRGLYLYLDIEHDCPWVLLPLVVTESICGDGAKSVPAAASLQFLLAAGDVFDDIQDADSTDSIYNKYGLAVAISVASTLLILGERCLTRLRTRGVGEDMIVRVIDGVNSFYTSACIGQHFDLTTGLSFSVSEEDYTKIISLKSAAQIECACYTGALIAGANQEVIDKFASLGHNLGMAAQISNDINGIISGKDIIKRKITLPFIYNLSSPDEVIRNKMKSLYQKQSTNVLSTEEVKYLLFQSGAMHYTTIKMELYKQKVQDILFEIQEIGINIENLKVFCK